MGKKFTKKNLRDLQNEINNLLTDFADCSICGYCCKDQKLTLHTPDVNRISRRLQINKDDFLDKFTYIDKEANELRMNMPCPFFNKQGQCTIYDFRPKKCRDYPVFVTNDFMYVMNTENCAKANLFYNAFTVFISKYDSVLYNRLEKEYDEGPPKGIEQPDAFVRIPMRYVRKFINTLA